MTQRATDEKAKLRRKLTEDAIRAAKESRWEDAVRINRTLLESIPDDVDSHNRLGKALSELGQYAEARAEYETAMRLDPTNAIARKNAHRLAQVKEASASGPVAGDRIDPRFFVEETGKTGVTTLQNKAPIEVLARAAAGEPVSLRIEERHLVVVSSRGEALGQIEPKMALRLIELINGGNRYEAAILSLTDNQLRIIIRESYQHPSQVGRISFIPQETERVRAYIRLSRQEDEDDELAEESDYDRDSWEEDGESAGEELPFADDDSDSDMQDEDDYR